MASHNIEFYDFLIEINYFKKKITEFCIMGSPPAEKARGNFLIKINDFYTKITEFCIMGSPSPEKARGHFLIKINDFKRKPKTISILQNLENSQ